MTYERHITPSRTADQLLIESRSAVETRRLGQLLAPLLAPGDIIPLWGSFGAGKTTFVQGIGEGLGVAEAVVSPSFGLINIYRGLGERPLELYHLDLYRVQSLEEAEVFGVEEVLDGEGAVVIEWPEVVRPLLPSERLDITLQQHDEKTRTFLLWARGGRAMQLLSRYASEIGHR